MATASVPQHRARVSPVQAAAYLVGAAFLVVGVLGFIPGVTTNYDMLTWSGHHSGAELFGVFQVSGLHNTVHLVFGVAGLAMGRTTMTARTYLIAGGVVYLALWVYGLVVDEESTANVIPVNTADNWLHLGLGAAMLLFGLFLGPADRPILFEGSPQPGRPEFAPPPGTGHGRTD
ncbi:MULTISPECIES: DUF4383 domain-containing protein [Nocardia]|uniref:DUF4383 domain-containing protein n=2 Tax=Nocardia TaxID=1817 RepID=A0A2T2Z6K2_9NOCA|nr:MULTISPECIES: DUF4383 domain-containing protein [Nocardia]MBF6244254.1 DUF4383 domain-containing protein [Nocardia elegans]MBF6448088.1 DUF4383 domain-containing protein [Nocardia elegans]PSR63388.1 DUF4383 domain-containing protein [Nocardia nova]